MKEFIEIPFGAKDSELCGWEYTIPEGYTASIENGKIVVKKEDTDDEKIRKELYDFCIKCSNGDIVVNKQTDYQRWAAWLEKQGEQKPADKVEPKFKVGDWVVYCNEDVDLITGIEENVYRINNGGYIPFICVSDIRHWTIQDAKDGDVLVDNYGNICIYQEPSTKLMYHSYCYGNNKYFIDSGGSHAIVGTYPATKEQRDLLFQKMKESGYEWDAEKKELRKIEQKPAWSEEDEEMLYSILNVINGGRTSIPTSKYTNWLKSFKDRVQPQQEWNRKDEETLNRIRTIVRNDNSSRVEDILWLKSIKKRMKGE